MKKKGEFHKSKNSRLQTMTRCFTALNLEQGVNQRRWKVSRLCSLQGRESGKIFQNA